MSEAEVLRAQLNSAQKELETSNRELKKLTTRLEQTEERLQRAKGDIVNERSASDAMGAALAAEESSFQRRQRRLLDAAKRFRELRGMLQEEAKEVSRQKAQLDAAWSLVAVEQTGLKTRREGLKRDIKRFELQRERQKKRESRPEEVATLHEEIERLEEELRKVHSELDHARADERMAQTRARGLEATLSALGSDTTIDMPPPEGLPQSDTVDSPPPPALQDTTVGPPPPMALEVEDTVPGDPPLGIEVADTVEQPALPFSMPKTLVDHDISQLYLHEDAFAEVTDADELPAPMAEPRRRTAVAVETPRRRTTWVKQEAMHLHFRMRFAWDMMSTAGRQWITFGVVAAFLALIAVFVALITTPSGPREPVRSAVIEPIELPPQPVGVPEETDTRRSKSKRRRAKSPP